MIEIKTYSKPKKTGGSGGSSSPTKYISGVISEAEHAGRADKAKRAEVADQANYAGTAASAQNAAYASEAGNLHADAEILQKYLSLEATKDPQVVKGQVKFEQLLQLLQGFSLGNICGFDGSGNGIINSVVSDGFNSASQQGFGIKPDDNGRYSLSITDLIVWGKAVFNELEIRKLSYAGGNVYLSGAGSKLVKVVPVAYNEETGGYITSTDEECDGWKCYILADDGTMATQNWWAVGDQARCQTFNIKPGAYNNASNKEYWRCVVAVSSESEFIVNDEGESLYGDKKFDWIILSKTNCLTGSDIPAEGDAIVLDGHQVQTGDEGSISRTNILMLESSGADTPRIVGYRGITDFTHEGKDVFVISPSNVTISSSVFKFKTVSGQTITIINDRGAYDPSVGYYYYDRVSYDNAYWTLIYSGDKQPVKGITPTEEAVNGIVYWRKDLSGGIKGDDAVIYTLEASPGYIRLSSDGSIDYTNGYINKGDEYGSDKYLVVRGYKVVKGVRDNRFSTEASPVTLRLTINDGSAYSEYTPSDGDSVSIDFEPKYEDSYYSMLEEISHSGLNSVRVDMCEGSEYNPNKILATCDIPIIQNGKGEGVVMAYKNDTSRPEPPVTEDLSLLTDGWSRTPQKGGSYEKVSNVSYGNYSVGATESGYSTSEWSEVSDSGETWRKSPAGLSNNGWALMKVSFTTNVDNADVRVVIKAYSETNFDFIQVHDIDREITGSTSLGKNGVVYTSGNGVEGTYSFTSVGAGQHFFYVSYCKDSSQNANGDYGLFRLDLSENLVSMPSTVWMSQAVLKEGKAVLPWSTPVQITGDDAYRVEVSPSTLVFDTNKNGLVDTLSGKYATVTVYKGNQKISTDNLSLPSNYATPSYTNVHGEIYNSNGEARITIDRIDQETISGDVTVSKSSGQISFPIDVLGERSTLMWVTVNVQVNVSKFTGSVAFDNKGYKAQFDALSKNAATKEELTQATSKFEQTAREISLSVSEKSIGRRNLLVGSAFRRQGEVSYILDSHPYFIRMNDGYGGTNCAYMSKSGMTQNVWCGAMWNPVTVKPNTKYTFSMMLKVMSVCDERFDVQFIDVTYNSSNSVSFYTLAAADKMETFGWTLKKITITTPSLCTKLRIDAFIRRNGTAYMCRPMLEEGENYNGWTLSEQDYDYVGGNLLDNARTLDKSGTLIVTNDAVIQNGYGTDSACIKNLMQANATLSDYKEVLRWIFGSTYLVNGNDYIFSFVAKADVDDARVVCYMWSGDIENSCDIFTEGNGGTWDSRSDGNVVFILSRQWTRYWVHWRPKDGYATPKEVIIRHTGNNSTSTSTVYVTQPKLEIGATMTEWTERKSDLIDKASLKAAGIEVTSEKVKLYGDQIEVKPKKDGNDVYALFGSDGFINTNILNVQHVYAKNTNGTVYGHFGYLGAEGGTDNAGNKYPLWVGASNVENAPFSVRSDGYMVTTSGRIGAWSLTERNLTTGAVVDSNYGTYMGTYLSMNEIDTANNINECKFLVAMGKGALYYDPFSPLKSGFYEDAKFRGNASERSDRYHVNSNNEHTYLSRSHYSSMYIKKEIGENSSSSRVDINQPALLVDSDGVGITSPGGNFFGGLAIGVLEAETTTDGQDASSSIREQLDDNRGAFVAINNAPGKITKFYLPKYPQEGQMLMVLQINSGTIRFYASNRKLMAFNNTLYQSGQYWTSLTQGQFSVFVYANGAWRIQFMNGR